ncbi:hypothetical protein CDD81_3981 [Ophiocordyceps australis]|uniref:Uncharacterized protein n=1 Tax=Ophiocordyceps australis TaxID=1399860 RepID=A0A2C5XAJ1_9HYPO|nr:hypothetical protein CDD81_3981 [Ophiocordyceps australis]
MVAEAHASLAATSLKRKAWPDAECYCTSKRHYALACDPRDAQLVERRVPPGPAEADFSNPPEPGSLSDTMRKNPRERLYLPPMLWTSRHLSLLNCEFSAEKLSPSADEPPLILQAPSDERASVHCVTSARGWAIRAVNQLANPCAPQARASAVRCVLAACDFQVSECFSPSLYFKTTAVNLKVDAIFASEPSGPTSLAYIDLECLHSRRRTYINKKFAPREPSVSVSELIRKKFCRIQPDRNNLEDPYIVAVLIALAQHKYRSSGHFSVCRHSKYELPTWNAPTSTVTPDGTQRAPPLGPFKVYILAWLRIPSRKLCLYTARISTDFLDKLEQPAKYVPSDTLLITYRPLPIKKPVQLLDTLDCALRVAAE